MEYQPFQYLNDSVCTLHNKLFDIALDSDKAFNQQMKDSLFAQIEYNLSRKDSIVFHKLFEHTDSYFALSYINFKLADPGIAEKEKADLEFLFDKLDVSLRQYKLYDECLILFNHNNNILHINAPLFPTKK